MWRIAKICPNCLEGEFQKTTDGEYACCNCGSNWDIEDLENMDYEE